MNPILCKLDYLLAFYYSVSSWLLCSCFHFFFQPFIMGLKVSNQFLCFSLSNFFFFRQFNNFSFCFFFLLKNNEEAYYTPPEPDHYRPKTLFLLIYKTEKYEHWTFSFALSFFSLIVARGNFQQELERGKKRFHRTSCGGSTTHLG